MLAAGITEIITHFAGLLRVPLDGDRQWHQVEGGGAERTDQPDRPTPHPHDALQGDQDDIRSSPSHVPLPRPGEVARPTDTHLKVTKPSPVHIGPQHGIQVTPAIGDPSGGGGGGGGDGDAAPASPPWPGADETVADVHQANLLIADVRFGTLSGIYVTDALSKLLSSASEASPHGLPSIAGSANDVVGSFKAWHGDLGGAGFSALTQGLTVDGTHVSDDGTPLTPAVPDLPDVGFAFDDHVVLGGNVVTNAAVLVDTSQAHLSSIVFGDSYRYDLISQVNVVHADASVSLGSDPAVTWDSGKADATNVAAFQSYDLGGSFSVAGSLGTTWNVKVVDGDFYDVKTVTQQNVLMGNVAYVGDPEYDHSVAVLGANAQVNAYDFGHDAPTYDLLIVGGDLKSAVLVAQTNVLLDDVDVRVSSDGAGGAGGKVSTGHDTLSNQASILDVASRDAYAALTPDVKEFAKDLLGSRGADGPANVAGITSAGATVNVLWVTGDYYDLTILKQVNVVSSDAVASVDLSKAGTQTHVVTGANGLSNSADVVTAGAVDGPQYVGGHAYDAALLHQANLVDDHASASQAVPWQGLATELVAFVDSGGTAHDSPFAATSVAAMQHHDVTAGIMA